MVSTAGFLCNGGSPSSHNPRRGLQEALWQLQEVLREVLRRTVATEEEIRRRLRTQEEPEALCGGESP